MTFHYAREKAKFDAAWEKTAAWYRAEGMSEEAIRILHDDAWEEDLQKKMDKIYPPKKTEENESVAKAYHKEKIQRFQKLHQNGRTKDDDTSGGVVISEENIPDEEGVIYDEGVRDDMPG